VHGAQFDVLKHVFRISSLISLRFSVPCVLAILADIIVEHSRHITIIRIKNQEGISCRYPANSRELYPEPRYRIFRKRIARVLENAGPLKSSRRFAAIREYMNFGSYRNAPGTLRAPLRQESDPNKSEHARGKRRPSQSGVEPIIYLLARFMKRNTSYDHIPPDPQ